jgi:ribosome maturation factor RimP
LRAAFFVLDQDLPHHTGLEARIADAIAPTLADLGYELVRVAVLGRERPTVQIMADRADGTLITVDDCEAISHGVGAVLDVADPIPGNWTLEVSSAGIDRPLTRRRDWNRFAGHEARAELAEPIDGRRRVSGIVLGADETHARMRLDDGTELAMPWADIRRAKLKLTDALIAATAAPPTTTN